MSRRGSPGGRTPSGGGRIGSSARELSEQHYLNYTRRYIREDTHVEESHVSLDTLSRSDPDGFLVAARAGRHEMRKDGLDTRQELRHCLSGLVRPLRDSEDDIASGEEVAQDERRGASE